LAAMVEKSPPSSASISVLHSIIQGRSCPFCAQGRAGGE
jgi:hypothetical protein